jgi:hypothetical protein
LNLGQVIKSLAESSNLVELVDGVVPVPLEKILANAQADSQERLAEAQTDQLPSNTRAKTKGVASSGSKKVVKTERVLSRASQTTSPPPSPPSPRLKYG